MRRLSGGFGEAILRVWVGCLKGMGGCLEGSVGCLKGVGRLSEGCVGVGRLSGGCEESV